jgi:hypothetical protein
MTSPENAFPFVLAAQIVLVGSVRTQPRGGPLRRTGYAGNSGAGRGKAFPMRAHLHHRGRSCSPRIEYCQKALGADCLWALFAAKGLCHRPDSRA